MVEELLDEVSWEEEYSNHHHHHRQMLKPRRIASNNDRGQMEEVAHDPTDTEHKSLLLPMEVQTSRAGDVAWSPVKLLLAYRPEEVQMRLNGKLA